MTAPVFAMILAAFVWGVVAGLWMGFGIARYRRRVRAAAVVAAFREQSRVQRRAENAATHHTGCPCRWCAGRAGAL